MKCFVYAIRSLKQQYIYVGLTYDVQIRVDQHNSGQSAVTRFYKPFEVLLIEEYIDRPTARAREKYLKSGAGKELLKSLVLT